MPAKRHEPAAGIPITFDRSPIFILNDPQISLPDLTLKSYYDGSLKGDVKYDNFEDGGAYRIEVKTPLEDGVYCFAQYGALVAPGQAMMWCFQIGNSVAAMLQPTITATISPPPVFRIVPVSYEKGEEIGFYAKPGWSYLSVTVAIENHSAELLYFDLISLKVHTSEGYDYDCSIASRQYSPAFFRTLLRSLDCEVPTQTSGYSLIMTYSIESLAPNQQPSPTALFNQKSITGAPIIGWV